MERFLNYFEPDRYSLHLKINRQHEVLSGKVEISGCIKAENIKFHAVGMQIKSVRYRNIDMPYDSNGTACEYTHNNDVINIPITPAIAPNFYRARQNINFDYSDDDYYYGETTFIVEFETKVNRNMQGCYLSTYEHDGKEKRLIATQFESHYAREAFPCIDEPAAKAKFLLTLEVDDLEPEDVALANTPCSSRFGSTFNFEPTPRMSTYLLAWVVGPLQSVSTVNRNGVKVSSYCALNQSLESLLFANDTAARALEYYDDKFAEKYPLPKLDQVALPDFEAGAMENWGLVTYRESMMLADKTASISTKCSVALTVTHELSHQWFGDLVTMEWWDDLWLNESFASVIEYYATDALYPEYNIWENFFTHSCLAALKRDCLPGVQAVQQEVHHPSEIATLFDGAIVYAKGAHLILMLIRLMSEEKFDQGIRYYFDKYKYGNTVGDNLWEALQLYADFDVKQFMHAWITQPGYPMLTRDGDEWQQRRFLITGDTDDSKWPIPEVKDDMSGHYLINLGDAEFHEKIQHFDQLAIEQKLRLMIDRMFLAKLPEIESSSLLELLPKLTHEKSPAVWGIVSTIIGDLKLFCPPETPTAENYKQYLRQILEIEYKDIDFSTINDVDSTTRRDYILSAAYYSEYEPTLQHLANLYTPNLASLDPELRGHIMAAKLYFDEDEVFSAWLEHYKTESDPELREDILFTLASLSKDAKHLDQLVALLKQPEIVRPQDHLYLYIYLLRNYRTRAKTLDWLLQNWDYVAKLTGEKSIEDYPRYTAGTLRTTDEAKKFYAFFDPKSDDPVLGRTIKIAHTEIDTRLALIASDAPDVEKKLKELVREK